ncbi:hypothetical protein CAEBREN_14270 [Caenorhabditis brenneri]|uniref:3-beta hydroxysteroid dehydrogenase/isomerase domain-containing protein n=1 Tax=Caenorhabditis brenneri TaxID=135651 RepID=G0M8E4_CAEBE|nr:hypothetical protein CAEBREN_14270 [Caenorhabditis brenneri]
MSTSEEKCYVGIGAGGFLGANLIASLQEHGDFTKFIVVDPNPRLSSFTHLKINLGPDFVKYEKSSFLEDEVLDRVLKNAKSVFHLAAIGHTGSHGAPRHHDYVRRFNVAETEKLLKKCRDLGVENFIYASSIAVTFVGKPIYDAREDEGYPSPNEEMVSKNFLMFKISKDGRETISNMSSGKNCGLAMHLANQALMKNGKNGQVYNITDGEEIRQYSVWNGLIKSQGKSPPKHFVSYSLVSAFVSLSSYICYEWFNSGPPLTRFELEVLVTDNTYSIEKAKKELNYKPRKGHFQETVSYYRQRREEEMRIERARNYELYILIISVLFVGVVIFCF